MRIGSTWLVLLVASSGLAAPPKKPFALVGRATHGVMFVPVERETWTMAIDAADHVEVSVVTESADFPESAPGPKPTIEAAVARAEKIIKDLTWKQTATVTWKGEATWSGKKFAVKMSDGTHKVGLDCAWVRAAVHPAKSKLAPPPGPKECGEYVMKWSAPTTSTDVVKCASQDLELPDWSRGLMLGAAPGVDHLVEEDDCAGGDGLRVIDVAK